MIEKQPPRHAQRKIVDDKHKRAFARDTGASQEPAPGWGSTRASAALCQKNAPGWNQFAGRSVLQPVIRYLALAFIVFQVATTTALATQVVLFGGESEDALSSTGPASAAPTQPTSPSVGEMAGRPEGRAAEHLVIQIDTGRQSQVSPVND